MSTTALRCFRSFSSPPLPRPSVEKTTSSSGLPRRRTACFCPSINASWLQDNSRVDVIMADRIQELRLLCSVFPTDPATVSAVSDLFDFICSGPLIQKLGYTSETVASNVDKWLECGVHLCRLFKLDELRLSPPERARIYHYYIPVYLWCEDQIARHREKISDGDEIPPLVIGVSAPQGSGKTTLVFALDFLFRRSGRNSATLSIDDFYLTAEDQAKLRSENPGNALLEFRGNAGSHDLPFSINTLAALTELKTGEKFKLPRYDKSAYGGRGDRADPSFWPEVNGPLTVILFEGWMLGFKPVPGEVVNDVDPQLEVVNKNLEAYHEAWDRFVESWIVIKIKDPKCVYQWRLEAEIAMRADGKPSMTDEEVLDFVSRYLPAYKAYLPGLYSDGPNGAVQNAFLSWKSMKKEIQYRSLYLPLYTVHVFFCCVHVFWASVVIPMKYVLWCSIPSQIVFLYVYCAFLTTHQYLEIIHICTYTRTYWRLFTYVHTHARTHII